MREIKSNNAKKIIIRKTAQECFTDRTVFSAELKKAYDEVNKNGGTCSLYFYGTGGYGKSTLLERLMKEKYIEDAYKIIYDANDGCSKIEILSAIWKSIKAQTNNKFIFPLFEPVLYLYSEFVNKNMFNLNKGKDISTDISKRFIDHLIESIRNSNIIKDVLNLSFAFKMTNDLKSIYEDISKIYKNNRLYDSNPEAYELLLKCTEKTSIENNIDKLFVFDLNYNIERTQSKPIIIFLDTIEVLIKQEYHHNISIKEVENLYLKNAVSFNEDWLIGRNGLIRNVNRAIWVLAGRNNIFNINDDYVYSYKLEEFNDEDSRYFLRENGIDNLELQNSIISIAKGAPIYLDMCVNIFLHKKVNNEIISPSDFKLTDVNKLTKLYCDCLNKDELKILRVLSLLKKFTKREAELALSSTFADYEETGNSFENVLNSANIKFDEQTQEYKINDVVSIGVLTDPSFDSKLKKHYLDKLFDKFLFDYAGRFVSIPDNQVNYDECDECSSIELDNLEDYSKIVDNLFLIIKEDKEHLNELMKKIVSLIINDCDFYVTSSFPVCIINYLKPDYSDIEYLCLITYYYLAYNNIFSSKIELKNFLLLIINSLKKISINKLNYHLILKISKLLLDCTVPYLYSNYTYKNDIKIYDALTIYDEIDVYKEIKEELTCLINTYIDIYKKYKSDNPFNEDVLMMYIVLNINNFDETTLEQLIEQFLSIIAYGKSITKHYRSFYLFDSAPEYIINCLYENKKHLQAKFLYETLYFNDSFPNNINIARLKFNSFDLRYLRILDSLKEYTTLNNQSKIITDYLKDYVLEFKDNNPLFTDYDIFIRHTYYSRSLYFIKDYSNALIENSYDVQYSEKIFNKTDKGYVYNKLLNSLCNYRLGNDIAFSIYNEIKDNCEEMFNRIDPVIKDEFLDKYSEFAKEQE